jgi:hypothetical protein
MSETNKEPNQNPGGGPGEKNKSSDIQEKHATVKIKGPKTAKDKPKETPAREP